MSILDDYHFQRILNRMREKHPELADRIEAQLREAHAARLAELRSELENINVWRVRNGMDPIEVDI